MVAEGYAIEIAEEIVGIVVRHEGEPSYRFHSAVRHFDALDGVVFAKPAAAECAARRHAAARRTQPKRVRSPN
jgi:hypothetical protein